jgi:DNA-binding transcriptional LysR family regulator
MIESEFSGFSSRKLDWNLLHTFIVIAESGGITAAAEKLGRKQPSVSNALRRLESHIGKKLFDRSPGIFRMTTAGLLLHREALEIYGTVERLDTLMRDVTDEVRGHIRIVMASHVVCQLFDEWLSKFHKRHPKATFSLDVLPSATALSEVAARRASLAICLVHERSEKLEYRRLYREYFGLFCGPSHPLFGRKDLSRADLSGHSAVSFTTDRFDDVLRPVALIRAAAELDKHVVARSSQLEEIRRLTIAGLGISALPIHVVKRDIEDGQLWRLPPYDDPPAIDVHLAWNPKARMNRAENGFHSGLLNKIEKTPIAQRTYL